MKAKILYISTRSHENLWAPISLADRYDNENFIFSTQKNDVNPVVIIELSKHAEFDSAVVIDIYNRQLASTYERILGLEVRTSENLYDWRLHDLQIQDEFMCARDPLSVSFKKNEKYLMLSKVNSNDHFHIGSIVLSPKCEAYKDYSIGIGFRDFCIYFGHLSNSQVFQDLFALYICGFSKNYFLEFGANDGISLSNTILLEALGWNGIIGEALNRLYLKAKYNRKCTVIEGALAAKSDTLLEFYDSNLLSSSVAYADNDMHASKRKSGLTEIVRTIRLDEVLKKNNAPKTELTPESWTVG